VTIGVVNGFARLPASSLLRGGVASEGCVPGAVRGLLASAATRGSMVSMATPSRVLSLRASRETSARRRMLASASLFMWPLRAPSGSCASLSAAAAGRGANLLVARRIASTRVAAVSEKTERQEGERKERRSSVEVSLMIAARR